jgi:hypothetical protein
MSISKVGNPCFHVDRHGMSPNKNTDTHTHTYTQPYASRTQAMFTILLMRLPLFSCYIHWYWEEWTVSPKVPKAPKHTQAQLNFNSEFKRRGCGWSADKAVEFNIPLWLISKLFTAFQPSFRFIHFSRGWNVITSQLYFCLQKIVEVTNQVLLAAGPRGHILNVGHGVIQGTPESAVGVFCETARQSGNLFAAQKKAL